MNLGRLNQARVAKHKVQYVASLRAVLWEMCKANRTAESLAAAEQLEVAMNESLATAIKAPPASP